MPWWGWLLIGLGLLAVLAVLAIAFRSRVLFAVKFARTLVTDQRVPRPLRWIIGISLAMKVVPFPDFGADEIVLIAVGIVLFIFYRPVLQAILEETRSLGASGAGPQTTTAPGGEDPAP